MFAVVFVE